MADGRRRYRTPFTDTGPPGTPGPARRTGPVPLGTGAWCGSSSGGLLGHPHLRDLGTQAVPSANASGPVAAPPQPVAARQHAAPRGSSAPGPSAAPQLAGEPRPGSNPHRQRASRMRPTTGRSPSTVARHLRQVVLLRPVTGPSRPHRARSASPRPFVHPAAVDD